MKISAFKEISACLLLCFIITLPNNLSAQRIYEFAGLITQTAFQPKNDNSPKRNHTVTKYRIFDASEHFDFDTLVVFDNDSYKLIKQSQTKLDFKSDNRIISKSYNPKTESIGEKTEVYNSFGLIDTIYSKVYDTAGNIKRDQFKYYLYYAKNQVSSVNHYDKLRNEDHRSIEQFFYEDSKLESFSSLNYRSSYMYTVESNRINDNIIYSAYVENLDSDEGPILIGKCKMTTIENGKRFKYEFYEFYNDKLANEPITVNIFDETGKLVNAINPYREGRYLYPSGKTWLDKLVNRLLTRKERRHLKKSKGLPLIKRNKQGNIVERKSKYGTSKYYYDDRHRLSIKTYSNQDNEIQTMSFYTY